MKFEIAILLGAMTATSALTSYERNELGRKSYNYMKEKYGTCRRDDDCADGSSCCYFWSETLRDDRDFCLSKEQMGGKYKGTAYKDVWNWKCPVPGKPFKKGPELFEAAFQNGFEDAVEQMEVDEYLY